MKFFLVALAIACAAAEPEADSDSFYPYTAGVYNTGLYGYRNTLGYTPYTTGFTGYSGIYNPYTAYQGVRVLGKREAEADSDAFYPYTTGVYNTGLYGYRSPLAYTAGYTPYTSLTGYTGYYNNVYNGVRVLGKREAESDSDSFYPYSGLYNTGLYGYRNTLGYTPYTTGFTGYSGIYNPYTAYQGVRVLGKREAEADPELVYRNPVTDFHTNARNVAKGINVPQTFQGANQAQVYNSVRVPTPVYTGYSAAYTTPYTYSAGFPYTTYSGLRYY